jgi:hypothetical protein
MALIPKLAGSSHGGGGGGGEPAVPLTSWLLRFGLCFYILGWCCYMAAAQGKHQPSLRDSLGKFDLSDYIIEAHGLVPVPVIITEPALGGFGVAVAPVFIERQPPYVDSVAGQRLVTPVAPDVTGGIGAYTLNGTFLVGAFRAGTLVRSRIKYFIGTGYANINIAFYKTFDRIGEKELQFNVKTFPVSFQAMKRIGYSHWYAGLKYQFSKTRLRYEGNDTLTEEVKPLETDKIVSQLGAIVELDNRDNIFTPDKGMKLHFDGIRSDNIFGSDYDFWRLDYYMYGYWPFSQNWIGGLRIDGAQTIGDVPFYLQPHINMRGIPAERYQGNAVVLTEAELRWDIVQRWSAVAFSGLGKAFDEWSDFGSADWITTWGAGFRYLLAKKFKLRMGLDIAHGAGSFAYYIIFGSNWLR